MTSLKVWCIKGNNFKSVNFMHGTRMAKEMTKIMR